MRPDEIHRGLVSFTINSPWREGIELPSDAFNLAIVRAKPMALLSAI